MDGDALYCYRKEFLLRIGYRILNPLLIILDTLTVMTIHDSTVRQVFFGVNARSRIRLWR